MCKTHDTPGQESGVLLAYISIISLSIICRGVVFLLPDQVGAPQRTLETNEFCSDRLHLSVKIFSMHIPYPLASLQTSIWCTSKQTSEIPSLYAIQWAAQNTRHQASEHQHAGRPLVILIVWEVIRCGELPPHCTSPPSSSKSSTTRKVAHQVLNTILAAGWSMKRDTSLL